ncbi:proteasome subunit alpha type-5 [Tanacetum coccineum]
MSFRVTDEKPKHFGDDALPRHPGRDRAMRARAREVNPMLIDCGGDESATNRTQRFSSTEGLDAMLENEDVGNVSVWVKLHGVPMTTFSDDGLSVIATKLGTPLMIDSYTSDMCMQSWGRLSYVRAMIELRADVELKDTIVDECPKYKSSDVAKNLKNPIQDLRGVPVGPKVGFKPVKQVYRALSKKNIVNISGNKKKDVDSRKEVSNPNPFDVLISVENDVELGKNEEFLI